MDENGYYYDEEGNCYTYEEDGRSGAEGSKFNTMFEIRLSYVKLQNVSPYI